MGLDLLKLAGEFARADQESKAARIQEAGQDIAEKKGIRFPNLFSNQNQELSRAENEQNMLDFQECYQNLSHFLF